MLRARPAAPRLLALALLLSPWIPARPAGAAVVPFTGELAIENFFGLPAITVSGQGMATVNGAAASVAPVTQLTLPAGAFAAAQTMLLQNEFLTIGQTRLPFYGYAFSGSNAPIVLDGGGCPTPAVGNVFLVGCAGTGLNGAGALTGFLLIGFFPTNPTTLSFPLSPIGAGTFAFGTGVPTPLVVAGGWTTGTAVVRNPYAGYPTPTTTTATAMGSRTTGGTGPMGNRLSFVSPILVALRSGGLPIGLPAFARIQVELAPEPGRLLLQGAAVAILALLGWRRARRGRGAPRE